MSADRPTGPSDGSLLGRVAGGSEAAAGELHARYARRLLGLVRARASPDLAARVDAEDIVQSAFGSFFRAARQGYYEAPTGEELWNLLVVITLNKVRATGARHRAARRDVRRTVGESGDFEPPADAAQADALLRVVLDDLLASLPEGHREVVRLRAEGFEVAEVAARTGRSKRTVERVLQELRVTLAGRLGGDE